MNIQKDISLKQFNTFCINVSAKYFCEVAAAGELKELLFSDVAKTEKTLPQLNAIKVFPTSIILDRKGLVNHINTSFYGPSTGEYYVQYKKEFEEVVDALLSK